MKRVPLDHFKTIHGLKLKGKKKHRDIAGLTADSREVKPDFLFAALDGGRQHGASFIPKAVEAGACAVLHDGSAPMPPGVVQVIHPQPRKALAQMASIFFRNPSESLKVVGITGTNGKTSVAAIIESILAAGGGWVGVIGTTGIRFPGFHQGPGLTTPEPVALQRTLRNMLDRGCKTAILEVSSHALEQRRTAGVRFDTAVFTNLTRDHLDYHPDMEAYFDAKARLFSHLKTEKAVINYADPWGAKLAKAVRQKIPALGFGVDPEPASKMKPDFTAKKVRLSWDETRFVMGTPKGEIKIAIPAAGRFNVDNFLAAAAACWTLGVREKGLKQGAKAIKPAPGRMEVIKAGQPFPAVVDFAHTPDALERLLITAQDLTVGKVIAVFGAGGGRDAGKRRLMGRLAGKLADLAIVTDDNPRDEDPAAIRQAIIEGVRETGGAHLEEGDRKTAIKRALDKAGPKDAVIVAGKGHESVQIVGSETIPFNDAEVIRQLLSESAS